MFPAKTVSQRDNKGVALPLLLLAFAQLKPETAAAFDRYVAQAEARMKPGVSLRQRDPEPRVTSGTAAHPAPDLKVPGGMVQDWLGSMFMAGATLAQVKTAMQDYENYKDYYQPEVIESRQTGHSGDEYDIFLRLYEKHVLSVVLNANYHVRYAMPDARRLLITSHSTRIAEVKNPRTSFTDEYPPGDDTGLLWRLNSYWRFEAADGGIYAECEAISLSRDVPLGLGFLLRSWLETFPKESMANTLRGTRDAIERHAALIPSSSAR